MHHVWHATIGIGTSCSSCARCSVCSLPMANACTILRHIMTGCCLGLSGIMSEAELHQIKIRLHQGERQKAARGELRLPLPAGLIHNRDGSVTFNPDEEVQERLRLVFVKFRELRSAKAVMRYLRHSNLSLPVRPLHGPAPHDIVWRAANSARVIHILKNPAYAGAYVYGRRRPDPLRRRRRQ